MKMSSTYRFKLHIDQKLSCVKYHTINVAGINNK